MEPAFQKDPGSLFEQHRERGRSDVVHFLKTACSPLDNFLFSHYNKRHMCNLWLHIC